MGWYESRIGYASLFSLSWFLRWMGVGWIRTTAVRIDDTSEVTIEGEVGGGRRKGMLELPFLPVCFSSPRSRVFFEIHGVELHEAAFVEKEQAAAVEELPSQDDLLAVMAPRHLVEDGVDRHHVVPGHRPGEVHFELHPEGFDALGKTELFGIPQKAIEGRLFVEALVGTVVVLRVGVVLKPQLEGAELGIDVGTQVKTAEDIVTGGLVELLDLAVALRVGLFAVDEDGAEAIDHGEGVLGDEARALVEVDGHEEPVLEDELIEPALEEEGVFGRADHGVKEEARRIVDEEHRHSASPGHSGPEVLPVTQDHVHAVGIGKAADIAVSGLPLVGDPQAAPPRQAVDGRAVHRILRLEDAQ